MIGPNARIGRVQVAVAGGHIGRHLIVGQRIAEVEETAPPLGGVFFEQTEVDLQVRDAPAGHVGLKAGLAGGGFHAFCRRDPAVAVAQQYDEEWPAPLDFVEADLENAEFLGGLIGQVDGLYPQPQVDGVQMVAPPPKPLGQLGKDHVLEVVPLSLHVLERAADKDRPRPPRLNGHLRHQVFPSSPPSTSRASPVPPSMGDTHTQWTRSCMRGCATESSGIRRWSSFPGESGLGGISLPRGADKAKPPTSASPP